MGGSLLATLLAGSLLIRLLPVRGEAPNCSLLFHCAQLAVFIGTATAATRRTLSSGYPVIVGADPSISFPIQPLFRSQVIRTVYMNRVLVAAHATPSPLVATKTVPFPVLRGATRSVVLELHRGEESISDETVTLPHIIDPYVTNLRVLSMETPAVVVMETMNDKH